MGIKLGSTTVNDLVIIGPDGNAKQCLSVRTDAINETIVPPTPAAVLNQDGLSSNFTIKYIKDGTETSFKSTSSTSGTLSNADLLNLRKIAPDAIIVESSSGTVDKDNSATEFKNYYPFASAKFGIGKKVVASPISSVKYFMKQEGNTDSQINTKIQNVFNVDISNLFNDDGNDTVLSDSGSLDDTKKLEKKLEVLISASKASISGIVESNILSAVAKQIVAETGTYNNADTFFTNETENILVKVKKDVNGIDESSSLSSEDATTITNISSNTKSIMDKDIQSYSDGNKVKSATLVKNLIEEQALSVDAAPSSFSSDLDTSITSVLQDILSENYVDPSGSP